MTVKDKQQSIDEQLLLSAAKSTLDNSVDDLDASTLERLATIRRQAVESATKQQASLIGLPSWLLPVGGLATAAAAVLVTMTLWTIQPDIQDAPVAVLEDINLLTAPEEIEFYQDLEFYEWLAVNEQTVG